MYHFGLSWYTAFPLERTGTCVLILSFQLLHYSFKVFRALTIHIKKIIIWSVNIIAALEPSSQPSAIIWLHIWSSCFHFFPKGNLTIFLKWLKFHLYNWEVLYASNKESSCQCKRRKRQEFSPWVRKIPWSRKWHPTPVFLPGKFHGQRSLVGYGPWGHKESDTSEQLSTQLEVLGVGVGIMKEVIFEKLLYNRCCIVGILLYDGYIQCYHI